MHLEGGNKLSIVVFRARRMKHIAFLLLVLSMIFIHYPFHIYSQAPQACLSWEKEFPRVDSKLALNISGLEIVLNPPSSAAMRSLRPGELVSPTRGQFKSDGKKELHIEFVFESSDPDECSYNCKERSVGIRSANPEEVYETCFHSCKENTNYKYGKDKFKLPLKLKIYRDESETLRIDSLTYRDPSPISGKLAYTFPHYFAGDFVECSENAWD